MTYPSYLREKARRMRREQRLSLDEIVERLALPRTTVFHWIRDIPLQRPRNDYVTPARERAWAAQSERYRLKREAAYARGAEEYEELVLRPTFVDFVVLYIAEGYKRNRNSVVICNSDPAVMVLSARWLRQLTDRPLDFSIAYHADQDLDDLRRFWSELLAFDPAHLRLTRKSNSNQLTGRTWRSAHGVLAITVSDTMLRARLQAWIDLTKARWQ
jgi:hypothetical protein